MMVGATYHQIGKPTKMMPYSSMLSRLAAIAGREAGSLISMVLRAFFSIQIKHGRDSMVEIKKLKI